MWETLVSVEQFGVQRIMQCGGGGRGGSRGGGGSGGSGGSCGGGGGGGAGEMRDEVFKIEEGAELFG
jgi:hypothetical protein